MKTLTGIFFLFAIVTASAQTPENGKSLFQNNCAICHSVGKGRLVGPDLAGVTEKRSKEWIFQFVTNSAAFVESGDEQAVAVFNEYNQLAMPSHDFSDTELEDLYAYLGTASVEVAAAQTADAAPDEQPQASVVQMELSGWIFVLLAAVGVVILALLGVIFKLLRFLQQL